MTESTEPASVPSPQDKRGTGLGLALGLFLSMLLAAALVIPAAKAGITPGVSPLVVLLGWVLFGGAMGTKLKRFLAISQVTGSAGAAVTAGVVFTAPILQIVARNQGLPVPPVDVPVLILAGLAGSFLGFGFVGLGTKRFLTDPRLPAPEAVACDRLIETAVSNPEQRPRLLTSLVPGLLGGAIVQAGLFFHYLEEEVGKLTLPAPWGPAAWMTDEGGKPLGQHAHIDLPVETAPLYLGIGALLTLPTAILVFLGGLVNAATVSWSAAHRATAPTATDPDVTFRWVGGAAMAVAVLYSLVMYVLEGRRSADPVEGAEPIDQSLLEQSPGVRRGLYLSIVLGMAMLVAMMVRVGAPLLDLVVIGAVALVLVSLLSGLGGLLSLQVGSSASPVSGTVFMGMLVLALTALGLGLDGHAGIAFIVPIVVAACVAICAANDSSQDYKTLQLNGFTVSDGFWGQILGLVGGAIVVPVTLWIAHQSNLEMGGLGLGDADALPAPQASFFGTVLSSLFLPNAVRPWGPIGFGAVLGLLAVVVDHVGKRRGIILSSLAFAVGIYLPSYIGTGMMLGALARFAATRKVSETTHEGILVAAGLITGQALMELLGGILILLLAKESVESMFAAKDAAGEFLTWPQSIVQASLVFFLLLIGMNYMKRRRVGA
ncbi:MAG: OPT/YSL family transporter [Planctomycetes bacterium]|nr:OPT/YSL family transporter [Planctomycetota bacterium]